MKSEKVSESGERSIPTYCGQCTMGIDPIKVLVKDGVAIKIEGNKDFEKVHPAQARICLKAKGLLQKLYNPHRIKSPMIRTNPLKGEEENP
ncbi:MAG: hypothetical protein Q8Q41_04255, partial [bacterium]|nr:hypothetical protein [bacterium]